jgi:hypothetical protein
MHQKTKFRGMKTLQLSLITMALAIGTISINAQTIQCEFFTVTGLEPDPFDSTSTLIIIEMAGAIDDFANYPYVASVTDCAGDTVATGGMFFFGQIGGTEQGYPVSALSDDVCLPLTIQFVYGDEMLVPDTCLFTFGSTDVTSLHDASEPLNLYPNPTQGDLFIESPFTHERESYSLFNQMGKMIHQGTMNTTKTRIEMDSYSSGIYMLQIGNIVVTVIKE